MSSVPDQGLDSSRWPHISSIANPGFQHRAWPFSGTLVRSFIVREAALSGYASNRNYSTSSILMAQLPAPLNTVFTFIEARLKTRSTVPFTQEALGMQFLLVPMSQGGGQIISVRRCITLEKLNSRERW